MTQCAVSVVVATHNRSSRLRRLLTGLREQHVDGGFEVIVVDDASTDDTRDVVAEVASTSPYPLRYERLERNAGPAVARNCGWRLATAPVIAFTDDDCMVEPGWLEAMVGALQNADIAQGTTRIDPAAVADIGPFGHTVEVLDEAGFYETCNMAYQRDVLERVAGFDESWRRPYGEDTDLAWRARKLGATTVFVPDAVVVHEVQPSSFLAHLGRLRRRSAVVRVIKRHPELRRHYPAGVFVSATHPWAVACAGTAVSVLARPTSPVRWVALAAASAGYARTTMRVRHWPRRSRQWVGVLPLSLAADLAEVAIFTVASVQNRTLML